MAGRAFRTAPLAAEGEERPDARRADELYDIKRAALRCIGGLLLPGAVIFAGAAPFGVAFAAASQRRDLPRLAAAAAGYVLWLRGASVKYLLALILFAALEGIARSRQEGGGRSAAAICAAASVAAVSAVFLMAKGASIGQWVQAAVECAMCFLCVGIFSRAEAIFADFDGSARLTARETIACLILLTACILPLSSIRIGDFSVGRCIGIIIVICCAQCGNMALACVFGAIVGLALGLSDREAMTLCAAYAVSGITGGIFARVGRLASVTAFIITNGIMTIYADGTPMALIWLYEVMAASAVSVAVPREVIAFFETLDRRASTASNHENELRKLMSSRLNDMSRALNDVYGTIVYVGERVRKGGDADITRIFSETADRVCRSCPRSMDCWGEGYDSTMDSLNRLLPVLRRDGAIKQSDFALQMQQCRRTPRMTDAINGSYRDYLLRRRISERESRSRAVECEQIMSMCDALGRLAGEFTDSVAFDAAAEKRIADFFEARGIEARRTAVLERDGKKSVEVEIFTPMDIQVTKSELTGRISELCGCELTTVELFNRGDGWLLTLSQREQLEPDVFMLSEKKRGEVHNGDTGVYFRAPHGKLVCMLSDGQGSGRRAAIDSTVAARIVERIMTAGFDDGMALRTLNAALLSCGENERATTADVCVVDLHTGSCDFIKAGGATTFVRRRGTVYRLCDAALPAGIMESIEPARRQLTLEKGDVIVLLTDGADCCDDEDELTDIVRDFSGDAQVLARRIMDVGLKRCGGVCRDDMTVMAVVL